MPMGEESKGLLWSHQMGSLECYEPMYTLIQHTPLHVQELMCDVIVPMEVEKDP
jgi:hypothetical protein